MGQPVCLSKKLLITCGAAVALLLGSDAALGQCGWVIGAKPIPRCCGTGGGRNWSGVTCTPNPGGNPTSSCGAGGVELWPAGFAPASPDTLLPELRDSTKYNQVQLPGASNGTELFHSVDIASNRLFVAYNAGLSVWDIGSGNAADPVRLAYRDGWQGHFLSHPSSTSEDREFTLDISVSPDTGGDPGDYLVGVASVSPVGPSLWRWDESADLLRSLYQHDTTGGSMVRMATDDGRTYMIASTGDGIWVYDATAAATRTTGCLQSTPGCSGTGGAPIRLGKIGSVTSAAHIDVIERAGVHYVVATDANAAAFAPMALEIWSLASLANPSAAVRAYNGGHTNTRGVAFFLEGGKYYLARVEYGTSNSDWKLKVDDVTTCLDSNGCASMPSQTPWSTLGLPTHQAPNSHHLTFSRSGTTPFLHLGFRYGTPRGAGPEGLFDMTRPGSTSGQSTWKEITATAGSYVASGSCNFGPLGYWGDYLRNNKFGRNHVAGRVGKFNGNYFYRAARGILDVHVRSGGTPDVATISTTPDPAEAQQPHWYSVPMTFRATPAGCTPASYEWDVPTLFSGWTCGIPCTGNQAAITFACGQQYHCGPLASMQVEASSDTAGCENADLDPAQLQDPIRDPRPWINPQSELLPGGEDHFAQCSVISFEATAEGLGCEFSGSQCQTTSPAADCLTFEWRVTRSDGLRMGAVRKQTYCGTSNQHEYADTFDWDSQSLFIDGFESGDTLDWQAGTEAGAGTGTEQFELSVTASNAYGGTDPAHGTAPAFPAFFVDPVGDVLFQDPDGPIEASPLGNGSYELTALSTDATSWNWWIEVELDYAGATVDCPGLPVMPTGRCIARPAPGEDPRLLQTIEHQWPEARPFRVWVEGSNCMPTASAIAVADVTAVIGAFEVSELAVQLWNSEDCSWSGFGGQAYLECDLALPGAVIVGLVAEVSGNPVTLHVNWQDGSATQVVQVNGASTVELQHSYGSELSNIKPTAFITSSTGATSDVVPTGRLYVEPGVSYPLAGIYIE